MKSVNIIITGPKLGEKVGRKLKKCKINYLTMPNCRGIYSKKESIWEFLGISEIKKSTLLFQCDDEKQKVILSYILKYHNKKNNGVMFKVLEENMETENKLFVGIVNAGKAEKLVNLIKTECQSGATICDARGSGENAKEFLGMRIDSNKEIVFSVMKTEFISKMKKAIKDNFAEENIDVITFSLPVSEFNKLHQE